MAKLTVVDPWKKKEVIVGDLSGSVFTKVVSKKHYFWKYKGYAIQQEVIGQLAARRCNTIAIKAPDGIYESTLADWAGGQSIRINGKHGNQVVLPITAMSFTAKKKETKKEEEKMDEDGEREIILDETNTTQEDTL